MTCRCASPEIHHAREMADMRSSYQELYKELEALKADTSSYTIQDVAETNDYLVLKILYTHPDGKAQPGCTFSGVKILVFEGVSAIDALKWRTIDPHFREKASGSNAAPSPIARFPGNDKGWEHAIAFVNLLSPSKKK